MYLSTITLKNFRKYAYDGANKHGITVNFHKGLNALIGENDSGKSAIIDAIKLVLQTQSGEFTRVMDEDFYISATGEIATEFSIDCIFEGFEINEAKNFVEWLSFEKDKTSGAVLYHDTMLNKGDPALKTKATSKAIVAQCLASNLRWAITEIASAGEGGTPLPKERMFDLDLFQTHIDEAKRVTLAEEIEKDPYLSYLILAIKHAAGIEG